ncbi:MAG: hypothetical protein KBA66_13735 [Leptospiraceae bacterium]|nr:hypothetical protein [Leptospiraceae bacterium]
MKFILFLEKIFSEKLGYFSQKQLSKSVGRQLLFLFVIAAFLVIFFGCIFALIGVKFEQGNVFWFALLSLLGPDSLYTIQNESTFIKSISLLLTFIGIIIFNGIIIAIVVSTIHSYFDEIKRGTGKVHEENTIVILGWNELVPSILSELNLYCQTEGKRITVVVLSEEVKSEIIQLTKINRNIEILFRTGFSYKTSDLKRLNLIQSKAILVFYNSGNREGVNLLTQDSYVIKTFISLHSLLVENEKTSIPILLNFNEIENSEYLDYISDKNVVFFNKNYYNAKFISLLLLNPNYYSIFHELLSYEGNEIYFHRSTSFVGKTFVIVLNSYPLAIPIGVRRNNSVILTPPPDFVIGEKDELILISESEKSIVWKEKETKENPMTFQFNSKQNQKEQGERIAIIGMNSRVLYVIEEFEKMEKKIFIYANESELQWKSKVAANSSNKENEIFIYPCEFSSESEIIEKIPLEKFDKILVLSSEEILSGGNTSSEDTDTLFKVLKLIHLKKRNPDKYKYQVLCEIQNPENEEIVRKIPESNFNYVLGNLIVAKILNMELINPGILQIYEQLLQKGGIDLDIKPLSVYTDETIEFQTLLENFYKQKKWILIGYIDSKLGQIVLNPKKETIIKPEDKLIYLEESDYKIRKTKK